ncbi:MAG: hypothetical protein HY912_19795 [Desulfomonile tiedjei]|uniref:Uncharacterized protein n=1 Tax=Desulfomonile tiedjei TaxID=2358 RepID=A0A9D6Z5Q3_9BACT|nr:hypothetical protein [Desulfomonile tiedjei]
MGLLPVPDEVKTMHEKIDRLVDTINSQNALLGQVLQRTLELGSYQRDLRDMQLKLEYLSNSVTTIKDCVRFK